MASKRDAFHQMLADLTPEECALADLQSQVRAIVERRGQLERLMAVYRSTIPGGGSGPAGHAGSTYRHAAALLRAMRDAEGV